MSKTKDPQQMMTFDETEGTPPENGAEESASPKPAKKAARKSTATKKAVARKKVAKTADDVLETLRAENAPAPAKKVARKRAATKKTAAPKAAPETFTSQSESPAAPAPATPAEPVSQNAPEPAPAPAVPAAPAEPAAPAVPATPPTPAESPAPASTPPATTEAKSAPLPPVAPIFVPPPRPILPPRPVTSTPPAPVLDEEVPVSFSTDEEDLAEDSPKRQREREELALATDAGSEGSDEAEAETLDMDSADPSESSPAPSSGAPSKFGGPRPAQPSRPFEKKPFLKKKGDFAGPAKPLPNKKREFAKKPGGKFAPHAGGPGGSPLKGKPSSSGNPKPSRVKAEFFGAEDGKTIDFGGLPNFDMLKDEEVLAAISAEQRSGGDPISFNELCTMPLSRLVEIARDEFEIRMDNAPVRQALIESILQEAVLRKRPVEAEGIFESTAEGYGLLLYQHDNYRIKPLNAFVSKRLVKKFGIRRGTLVKAQIHAPRLDNEDFGIVGETTPFVLEIQTLMGKDPEANLNVVPFEELVPYYPTERLLLETSPEVKWDNLSMRTVDLLTPIGKGQRGLIVAPPRTGKTVLQQGIANAIMQNNPEAHLIVLLVDERPEEVTDFRRQIHSGEVIASTFDESPESHVHAAEIIIEKARRMVEDGRDVIILLDSITRLARAYNALAGNSGKILSGGVEANALQKPKRFFGSARNIEGGGSLTILGTALVETGSRMDEVIFEEFKGTGNMELHLDRALVDKRIFPAISLEKSGTRKEELLYHPQEMQKVYGLRRAMKGVPGTEAMEMLITRIRKTSTNAEFLLSLQR